MQQIDYVKEAEIFFFTGSEIDFTSLKRLGDKAKTYIDAMKKLTTVSLHDCGSCDYVEACNEVVELRRLKDKTKKVEIVL